MNIAVFGAKGRVGSKIVQIAKNNNTVWQIDKNYSTAPLQKVDVAIDFSVPSNVFAVSEFCQKHNCPLVYGVTNLTEKEQLCLDELSQKVEVVQKSNFSIGVQILQNLCDYLSQQLPDWDCEIVETHHSRKKDAPSGTAKNLAAIVSLNKGTFQSVTVHSLRCGTNAGCHQVIFATQGQSITLTHQAENIDIFAEGALQAAMKIADSTCYL